MDLGGQPFVLAEQHKWLRAIATSKLRNPVRFWRKLETFPKVTGGIPVNATRAIQSLMPDRVRSYRMVRRVSELGSLGRQAAGGHHRLGRGKDSSRSQGAITISMRVGA